MTKTKQVKPVKTNQKPVRQAKSVKPGFLEIPLPAQYVAQVSQQLVQYFGQEIPPADFIEVVPGSLKAVDTKFRLYKGLVRTDVYIQGVKQHISNIRFKVDPAFNVIFNSITFSWEAYNS